MNDDTLRIHLTLTASPSAPRMPLTIEKSITSSQLREQISEATKIPLASLRLIFRGRLIGDDKEKSVVDEYKLEAESVLHCMGKPDAVVLENTAPPAAAAVPAGPSVSVLPNTFQTAPTLTPPYADPLQAALATLRSSNSSSVYLTAVNTLDKILSNIATHPLEEKYRRVKKNNAAFQKRLGGLTGGEAAMLGAGFVIETNADVNDVSYVIQASADAWPKLMATKSVVEQAVRDATAATGSVAAPAGFGGTYPAAIPGGGLPRGLGAGMPGLGGMPGGAMTPEMERAVATMMADPNALQSMLQNPMVRNMIQNDPRFANNPMLRESLDTLTSNPQMLNQVSQMMQDPAMRNQMQSMMNAGGGGMPGLGGMPGMGGMPNMGGMPPLGGAAAAPSSSNTAPGASSQNNTLTDQEMTEEEMIAEAIQRSLRET